MGQQWQRLLKRAFDFTLALLAIACLGPAFAICVLLVRVFLGRPIFFRQERIGHMGRTFTIYKLRTMLDTRDERGNLLSDGERLTAFGRWLRKTSLDELPQLWNVLQGEMSLVGPRPLLPQYLPRYSAFQRRRHEAIPGITGWAQIHGRNDTEWEKRFEFDVWYVDNWSLRLDMKILMSTIMGVVTARNVSQAGHVTMPEFLGSHRPQ